MAVFKKGPLFIPSLVQCRHRVNTRRPKPGLIGRRIFEAVTKPVVLEKLVNPYENCSILQKSKLQEEEPTYNAYEQFLVRQCRKVFEENSMLVAFQPFSIKGRILQNIEIQFLRKGLKVHIWFPEIIRKAIAGTKWENMDPLLVSKTVFVACPEPRVAELIAVSKKIPEITLLGGLVEDRIMSYAAMVRYSQLPPLDYQLGELVSVLNAGASRTLSHMGHHQQNLARNLEQYVTDQSPSDIATEADKSPG